MDDPKVDAAVRRWKVTKQPKKNDSKVVAAAGGKNDPKVDAARKREDKNRKAIQTLMMLPSPRRCTALLGFTRTSVEFKERKINARFLYFFPCSPQLRFIFPRLEEGQSEGTDGQGRKIAGAEARKVQLGKEQYN